MTALTLLAEQVLGVGVLGFAFGWLTADYVRRNPERRERR